MDVPTFISDLLNAEKRVSIPGLGTLSARAGGQESFGSAGNEQNGAFFPFLGEMNFSERFDPADRRLAGKIAESRGISLSSAGYEVDKFVIRVKQEISRKGVYELPALGKLMPGASGKLLLKPAANKKELFGLSPVELKPAGHDKMAEVISKKIGLKKGKQNKWKIIWAILAGLIILALVLLLLVRLNIIKTV